MEDGQWLPRDIAERITIPQLVHLFMNAPLADADPFALKPGERVADGAELTAIRAQARAKAQAAVAKKKAGAGGAKG